MSVALTGNFLQNARGVTLSDANGVTWTINRNTNSITASVSGAAGGTVTSVGLADGSATALYTIGNSPVITSGTLTFTLKTQNANLVFAGPPSGGAAQPAFRTLVTADLPGASGTFTGTLTGVTGTVTGTFHYTIVGNICTVSLANSANVSGTSNATSMTVTGLPAACQPATQNPLVPVFVEDNGVGVLAVASIAPGSGTITFLKAVVSGTAVGFSSVGFTSSGTKGLDSTVLSYSLQ